jgi:hypothetical protein
MSDEELLAYLEETNNPNTYDYHDIYNQFQDFLTSFDFDLLKEQKKKGSHQILRILLRKDYHQRQQGLQ